MVCLRRSYQFKFFKGCLPQISLGRFLNALFHMKVKTLITVRFYEFFFFFLSFFSFFFFCCCCYKEPHCMIFELFLFICFDQVFIILFSIEDIIKHYNTEQLAEGVSLGKPVERVREQGYFAFDFLSKLSSQTCYLVSSSRSGQNCNSLTYFVLSKFKVLSLS